MISHYKEYDKLAELHKAMSRLMQSRKTAKKIENIDKVLASSNELIVLLENLKVLLTTKRKD